MAARCMAYSDASVNEARYQVLMALGKKEETLNAMKTAVKYNAVTNDMLAALRQQSGCKTDADFQKYMDGLKSSQKSHLNQEMKFASRLTEQFVLFL